MKKLIALAFALVMIVGCSSDDNSSNNSSNDGDVSGVVTSKKIATPKWLQGSWKLNTETGGVYFGYNIKPNDICFVHVSSTCYQGIINEALRVSKDAASVTQEYDDNYYKVVIELMAGAVMDFEFYLRDDGVLLIYQNETRTEYVRK